MNEQEKYEKRVAELRTKLGDGVEFARTDPDDPRHAELEKEFAFCYADIARTTFPYETGQAVADYGRHLVEHPDYKKHERNALAKAMAREPGIDTAKFRQDHFYRFFCQAAMGYAAVLVTVGKVPIDIRPTTLVQLARANSALGRIVKLNKESN